MKLINVPHYQCEICKRMYAHPRDAELCEEQPVTQSKGVMVGDIVRITQGQGAGEKAVVESVFIIDREWDHRAWKLYWHTVAVTAKLCDSWGSRMLTFDSYEPLAKIKP